MATQRAILSDMRTAVRDNLDEATAAFWTDARLNRNLSRAAHLVWQEVRKTHADYGLVTRLSTDGSPILAAPVLSEALAARSPPPTP